MVAYYHQNLLSKNYDTYEVGSFAIAVCEKLLVADGHHKQKL